MTTEELARVHARIAELEALLRHPPAPKRAPWFAWVIGALCIIFAFVAAYAAPLKPKRVEDVVVAPLPEAVAGGSLVLATADAPALWSAEHASYAVVLGFRPGPADVCVVAFDRTTWKIAWKSGPIDAAGWVRGRVVATGKAVAFAGAGDFIAFDAKSGEERQRLKLDARTDRAFADPTDPDWVIVTAGHLRSPYSTADAFNVETGVKRPHLDGKVPACPTDRSRLCLEGSPEVPREVRERLPNASHAFVVRDGTDEFLLVHERVQGGPGMLEHAVVRDGTKIVWHGALAPKRVWKPWPNTVPEGKVAFAHGRILYSYIMPNGDQRITARDYHNGEVLYDEAIPSLGYGSSIGAFTAEGDEAFLVANQSLIVLDARDGKIKKRITAF